MSKTYPGERQAVAIQTAKKLLPTLEKINTTLWDTLDTVDAEIGWIQTTDENQDLVHIRARIERLQELRRMMELGSFTITINRALDRAYRALP